MANPERRTKKDMSASKSLSARPTASLVPLDLGRSSPILPFVDCRLPEKTRDDLVLAPEIKAVLSGLLEEFRRGDTLRRHGLPLRSRLLFCGPPGCGKTATAEAFAHETGLDFLTIRLDAVVSSFLGETASNLKTVIEAAERKPCILFFDEFDALARSRTDPTEHSEIRRVVNSLLMLFERFSGRGFLIAATNLETELDDAIWRRFDEVVVFDPPTPARIKTLLKLKTRGFPAAFDIESRAAELKGFSFADVERVVLDAAKSAVLSRRKRVSEEDFNAALKAQFRRMSARRKLSRSRGKA